MIERIKKYFKWCNLLENESNYIGFLKVQKLKLESMNKNLNDLQILECIRLLNKLINEDFVVDDWYDFEKKKEACFKEYLTILNDSMFYWEHINEKV